MNRLKTISAIAALCVLALGVWLAPRFVDQNSLRAWVAPQLQHALRQEVAIDGAIDFALLPRPMVQVRQIRVGGPGNKIADIPEIEATLKIWPLLTGRLEPDQLVLSRPDIQLDAAPPAKPPGGTAPPAGPAPAAAPPSAAFRNFAPRDIGRIVIEKGTLTLPGLVLSPVDLKIVTGPDALSLSGRVGAGRAGMQVDGDAHWLDGQLQASNLALRTDSGAVLRWTGQGDPQSAEHPLRGKLTGHVADPAALLGDRMPAVPVGLSGDVTAGPDRIDAANLVLSVGDADVQGDGQYIPGPVPRVALRLRAATLDLARMPASTPPAAAANAGQVPPPPPPPLAPAAAPAPPRPLPFLRDAALQLDLSAGQILWRGEILQDATLKLSSSKGVVTIDQAGVTLPGNSRVALTGSIDGAFRLAGSFQARSDDLRALLRWASLDPSRVPADRLHAASLAGRVTGDLDEISLEGVRLKLDSSILDFSAAIRPGPRPAVGLAFALDSLNGDAYWQPGSRSAPVAAPAVAPPGQPAGPAVPPASPKKSGLGLDAEVHGRIGHLVWRGHSVADVALDASFTAGGVTVRSLTAGDLAGAELSVSGAVSRTEPGWRVDHAKATLHSRDIGRTLRSLGVDLPLDGQADIAADLSGPWPRPALSVTAPVLNLGKAYLDHVAVDVTLPPGRIAFDHLTAGLYGGQLTGQGVIAHDGGSSTLHLALAGAQMKKALLEVADLGLADGEMSGQLDLSSTGKPGEMAANLAGTGALAVKNGVIHGFDLKAANDKLKGKEGIGGLLALLQAGLTGGDTHFSSLTGTAKADHGVIVTNDLKLDAEGGGATGVANINLPADTIDAHADFRFANAHDAPPLTMRLQGSLRSPHRYLDVKPLQQWLAEHGVKTGKPKDVLKGLLRGLIR